MALNVAQLAGITPELAKALKAAGLEDSRDFLKASDTPAKRRHLANEFGVDTRPILELANRADLAAAGETASVTVAASGLASEPSVTAGAPSAPSSTDVSATFSSMLNT